MPTVNSHATADEFLHTRGKPVARKKVANNTYLERLDDNTIGLKLHNTYVVKYHPERISLHTGGWLTVTTKDRINGGLAFPIVVLSDKGTWYLSLNGWHPGERYRFTEGITLMQRGGAWAIDPATLHPQQQQDADDRHNKAMRALTARWLKGLDDLDDAGCALCLRHQESLTRTPGSNRYTWHSIGDQMGDTQHLVDHMIDGVLPADLLNSALNDAGYIAHSNHSSATQKRVLRAYMARRLYRGATTTQHGRSPIPTLTGATA